MDVLHICRKCLFCVHKSVLSPAGCDLNGLFRVNDVNVSHWVDGICYVVANQLVCPQSGPYWTHILFTWTKSDGLKVYINGTFTTGDATGGNVSEIYGDPYPDLLIGTGNNKAYGHYVTGAFDEFVIWERALSPKEIFLYYSAATGRRTPHSHFYCSEEKPSKRTFHQHLHYSLSRAAVS